jgi:serine/threonine protein kinase
MASSSMVMGCYQEQLEEFEPRLEESGNAEHAEGPPAPTIEGIEMLRRIGTGRVLHVYRGFEPRFKRDVAVKVLHAESLDDASHVRIERECAAIGTLSSSHYVAPPYRFGTTSDGLPYLVMERRSSRDDRRRAHRSEPCGSHPQ